MDLGTGDPRDEAVLCGSYDIAEIAGHKLFISQARKPLGATACPRWANGAMALAAARGAMSLDWVSVEIVGACSASAGGFGWSGGWIWRTVLVQLC